MPPEKHQILDIISRYAKGKLSEAETDAFFDVINEDEVQEMLAQNIDGQVNNQYAVLLSEEKKRLLFERIKSQRPRAENNDQKKNVIRTTPTLHRVHFLKTAWFRYAAAIILLATGIATYYLINEEPIKPITVVKNEEILPGSDKAILTLSNGEKIELNNATSETITDGTLSINNVAGELVYKGSNGQAFPSKGEVGTGEAFYNTMSTPTGGQYKLTLADGTRVWLNASSSITYPTLFNEKTRTVIVTGEAYLEVAKRRSQPFTVKLNDGSFISVLGTSFNINSYPNETNIKTTLLEGSIKVSKNNNAKILSPNQQAIINEKIVVDTNIDPEQIIAWKNGVFNFNDADLPTVMRQLERWYDIKVEYRGKTNQQFRFRGELQRNLTLSQVLKVLERMEVRFKLEGKKLIVNP